MKNQITILVLLLFVLQITAQRKGQVELGAFLGYNSSTVVESKTNTRSPTRNAINFGASFDCYISEAWSFGAKLIYDKKGWNDGYIDYETLSTTTNRIQTNFEANYLTVPLSANWHFGSTRKWHLNFGPYLGFLLSAKDSKLGADFSKAFNAFDMGLVVGIGYKFPVNKNTKISIDYESQAGITNAFTKLSGFGVEAKNSSSAFNLGVLYTLD